MNIKLFKTIFYSICASTIFLIGVLYVSDKLEWTHIFNNKIKKVIVRGSSMYPYYKNGQELKADFSYLNTYKDLQRGDAVVADFQNSLREDLLKFIKVAPGDKFHVDENSRILYVNDVEMKNSQGNIFVLTKQNVKMIRLYENTFNGVMPKFTYFIFGDRVGTIDSGKFGPVSRNYIKAKILN